MPILHAALRTLREELLEAPRGSGSRLDRIPADHRASARNLVHYLALREHDLRGLQDDLAEQGLSSLGRIEAHSLATVEAVLSVLDRLCGRPTDAARAPIGFRESGRLLRERAAALLGAAPEGRKVRVMVTAPSEAAGDPRLVERLLEAGMDCLRINCAHDEPSTWAGIVTNLRRAEERTGRRCPIQMDAAGPKLRIGELPLGPAVLKVRPQRDELGRVVEPARVWITAGESPVAAPDGAPAVTVAAGWLQTLAPGDRLELRDARGKRRTLCVGEAGEGGRWVESSQTAYILSGSRLTSERTPGQHGVVGGIPRLIGSIRLHRGETLRLTADGAARLDAEPPSVPCTLPEVFDRVRVGEPVWFDDGRLGGVAVRVDGKAIDVRITHCPPAGVKLRGDKGINLPDTDLDIPAITSADESVISLAAREADLLGLSFVSSPQDVRRARSLLREGGGGHVGLVLKIETKRAFEALPELLLAALEDEAPCGVMIARGDLAVECGYERLAEVQEEILWLSEAAHLPVIWATQVLEGLAKTGTASRAEITDAAMAARAECVMLNKGPQIVEAIRSLDDILGRMSAHQDKKRALLRRLRSFSPD